MERPEKIDEILHPEISSFLMLIKDHDRVIICCFLFHMNVAFCSFPFIMDFDRLNKSLCIEGLETIRSFVNVSFR